jgi:ABC-type multidrug transport system fused ATPase/permease subunit
MAYFDRMENSSSAISVRLSSGAAALEQMIGSRLAVITEPFAMCLFGFLAGLFVSWQLTMVLALAFLITGTLGILKVKINTHLSQQYHLVQKRANAVSTMLEDS